MSESGPTPLPDAQRIAEDTLGQGGSDPWLLRGGTCVAHGEYNNFSGRCLACDRLAAVAGRAGQ